MEHVIDIREISNDFMRTLDEDDLVIVKSLGDLERDEASLRLSLLSCYASVRIGGENISFRTYNTSQYKMIKYYNEDSEIVKFEKSDVALPQGTKLDEKYLLPIGTVLMLKNSKKVMIVAREIYSEEGEFDYSGCSYPTGLIADEEVINFNKQDIFKVLNVGWQMGEY